MKHNYKCLNIKTFRKRVYLQLTDIFECLGDGLKIANGRSFSTKDRDNDSSTDSCARERHAAWWFKGCDYANLNGLYNNNTGKGPYWWYWHSNTDPLKKDIMMIKRK